MVDGDIHHDAHIVFMQALAKRDEGLIPTKLLINMEKITAVIAVGCPGDPDGIEIQHIDTQGLEVRDGILNALEIPIEEVKALSLIKWQGLVTEVHGLHCSAIE